MTNNYSNREIVSVIKLAVQEGPLAMLLEATHFKTVKIYGKSLMRPCMCKDNLCGLKLQHTDLALDKIAIDVVTEENLLNAMKKQKATNLKDVIDENTSFAKQGQDEKGKNMFPVCMPFNHAVESMYRDRKKIGNY